MPHQAIHANYSEWLEATARERSNYSGVLFARQITNMGRDLFEGMTEDELCKTIGCDRQAVQLISANGAGKPGTPV